MNGQKQAIWRKKMVFELISQGMSAAQISRTLQVNESTISRDLKALREESKERIKEYLDKDLPFEYNKILIGINSILKVAWDIGRNEDTDNKERISALSLARECYSQTLDLLTHGTVVTDSIKFVESAREKLRLQQQQQPNKQEGNNSNNNTTATEPVNQVF